ncbi:DsrE family protein [Novosphingobium sp. Rr 2-17]|uniref:DsrE family protein n=1 Tax=Novosphingobium sp. Rr 2-17 TaxID=555793 RepID=UPI00178C5ED9|nr:DsrE family protein [Novosphingobium sp. Rr 2-17]
MASGTGAMPAGAKQSVISDFGAITSVEGAGERPDRSLRYRVLFSVTKAAATPDKINPSLEKVARFLNLLGADGVRPAPGDVVVIVHGPATPIVVDDAAYAKTTGNSMNPNLALIGALTRAGVSVRVCSQALVGNKIAPATVDKVVHVDVSALTTMASLQLRGWALIPD